ncbi:MAG: tetratricopeptide repeat protein [Spirochaetia bacterium]
MRDGPVRIAPKARIPGIVLLAAILLASSAPSFLPAQAAGGETLENLTSRAQDAITHNAYESAVKLLTEAKNRFPGSPRASLALGDLYYDKELYTLALGEYREAEKKGATDFATLTQISRCFGKLNQEKSSIGYLNRILQQYPDSTDTMDDLGWMYFKTHQLDKGEKVLLKGIAKVGLQRSLTMTLGTIYSGMNRYEKSREYYQKSVDDALRVNDRNFASIAYYNLSLLEHNFFHFNSALRFTDESIAMEDRPSGHLARGELFQSRMDFGSAQQEYQYAYAKDTTPLSKVNLAILFQKFGRLELSRRYAEEVLGSKDYAWLVYYGTDLTRHLKDIHELLGIVYAGLAVHEISRPTTGIIDRLSALAASVRDRVLSWYHDQRFHAYSLQVLDEGSYEDAWWEYYKGNESYPDVALKYLGLARELETARTPHAAPYYTLEEGRLTRSAALLEQSLAGFDPFWEKEPAAEALAALVPLLKGASVQGRRRDAISQLYQINPGALPQAGIGLPLAVSFQGTGWKGREKALVLRFLRRAGSECTEGRREGFPYVLRLLRAGDTSIHWTVLDASGTVVREGKPALAGGVRQRSAALVHAVLEELYSVH